MAEKNLVDLVDNEIKRCVYGNLECDVERVAGHYTGDPNTLEILRECGYDLALAYSEIAQTLIADRARYSSYPYLGVAAAAAFGGVIGYLVTLPVFREIAPPILVGIIGAAIGGIAEYAHKKTGIWICDNLFPHESAGYARRNNALQTARDRLANEK